MFLGEIVMYRILKFIYSEKATNFYIIFNVDLSYVVTVKSSVEISQNFVAFSEGMNFTANRLYCLYKRTIGEIGQKTNCLFGSLE